MFGVKSLFKRKTAKQYPLTSDRILDLQEVQSDWESKDYDSLTDGLQDCLWYDR